jgi:hypothetical protein
MANRPLPLGLVGCGEEEVKDLYGANSPFLCMRYIRTFLILLVLSATSFQFSGHGLKIDLKGEWNYQYSLLDGQKTALQTGQHCPVYKMVFKECNDARDMNRLPHTVLEMRKGNTLENLCCRTYTDSLKLIDIYFPVVHARNDTLIEILEYGNRFKDEWYIVKLEFDTLMIRTTKCYPFNGKNCVTAKHVYVRKT